MREEKKYIDEVLDKLGDHLKTRQEYVKLVLVEKSSKVAASIISNAVIFIFFLLFFVFINLSLAYFISMYTGKTYLGFGAVGLLYLLLGLVLYVKREKWLKVPIMNTVVKNALEEAAYEED